MGKFEQNLLLIRPGKPVHGYPEHAQKVPPTLFELVAGIIKDPVGRRAPPRELLQLCVLRLGLLQYGDVGIGVLPQREEILIGRPSSKLVVGFHPLTDTDSSAGKSILRSARNSREIT